MRQLLKKSNSKETIHSITAITLLLVFSIVGTWLVSMAALTVVTAQEIYDQLYEYSRDFTDSVSHFGLLDEFYDRSYSRYGYQYERPDFLEYQMLYAIANNSSASYYTGGYYNFDDFSISKERHKLIRNISYKMETAVLFYDADGTLLHNSDRDTLYFDYFTQEEWDAGRDTTSGLHYGWIDISEGKNAENYKDDPYLRFRTMYAGTHNLMDIAAVRVEGYFEGNELKPVVMHYITETMVHQIVESTDQFSAGNNSFSYIVSDVDRTGKLEWQLQFDRSAEYNGRELITVYIEHPEMWNYTGTPLVYRNEEYENLADLTKNLGFSHADSKTISTEDFRQTSIFELNNLLIFGGRVYADYEGADYESSGQPETEFILVTAIRSNPLTCSMSALRNVYIATGLFALLLLLRLRSMLKEHLVQPVSDIVNAMEDGWANIYHPDNAPTMWHEAEKLSVCFASEQDRRRMKDNEIIRLNTALEYAKAAEQNRRQMTSNIAHELKTPLAVIHSYAEGLKEHIAEDKRDKYIDVILSEAERTDGMVLEMLDLSRLEAGKVKLSRDDFSLVELTRSIFEKLDKTAQAKKLQIEFSFPDNFTITADEARIAQVVENFATNAIKYTSVGGHVGVRIQAGHSGVAFSIENECEPLSNEALSQIWDTFYRGDEARSGEGTGLGLAIAKNIVELHGGKCSVRNTKAGVEFRFTIKQ